VLQKEVSSTSRTQSLSRSEIERMQIATSISLRKGRGKNISLTSALMGHRMLQLLSLDTLAGCRSCRVVNRVRQRGSIYGKLLVRFGQIDALCASN
jgi:hypothetical protein